MPKSTMTARKVDKRHDGGKGEQQHHHVIQSEPDALCLVRDEIGVVPLRLPLTGSAKKARCRIVWMATKMA